MRTTTFGSAAILLSLSTVASAQRVLQMGVSRSAGSPPPSLRARSSFTESIINNVTGGSYMISTTVGTPPQNISLVLDTGSADVFVLASTANQCTSAALQREYGPCVGGTFKSASSSTYKLVNTNFDISYEDGSGSTGDYFTDTFTLSGGHTITNQQMGLALKTTVGTGIMGIGYDTDEASRTTYPSVIDMMVSQNLISTKAYSLWLDDLQASTGQILFGGIDTAKYHGSLIALPIQKDQQSNTIESFTVTLSSVTGTGTSGNTATYSTTGFAAPVVLDSGTTLTYLPSAVVTSIYKAFGVRDETQTTGEAFIDCSYQTSNATINYSFGGSGGPTISVPLSELVFPLTVSSFGQSPFATTCTFGIMATSSGGSNLLGDTFLRSAYVVYDLSANQIALAQTNFGATGSNVQEISASATGIPNVSGVATSVQAGATGLVRPGVGGNAATGTVTGTGTATGTAATGAAASSKAAGARVVPPFELRALGVAGFVGAFGVLGAGFVVLI